MNSRKNVVAYAPGGKVKRKRMQAPSGCQRSPSSGPDCQRLESDSPSANGTESTDNPENEETRALLLPLVVRRAISETRQSISSIPIAEITEDSIFPPFPRGGLISFPGRVPTTTNHCSTQFLLIRLMVLAVDITARSRFGEPRSSSGATISPSIGVAKGRPESRRAPRERLKISD